jgi:hypothetical protein
MPTPHGAPSATTKLWSAIEIGVLALSALVADQRTPRKAPAAVSRGNVKRTVASREIGEYEVRPSISAKDLLYRLRGSSVAIHPPSELPAVCGLLSSRAPSFRSASATRSLTFIGHQGGAMSEGGQGDDRIVWLKPWLHAVRWRGRHPERMQNNVRFVAGHGLMV